MQRLTIKITAVVPIEYGINYLMAYINIHHRSWRLEFSEYSRSHRILQIPVCRSASITDRKQTGILRFTSTAALLVGPVK